MSLFTKQAGVWTKRVPFAKKVTGYAGSSLTVKVAGVYVPEPITDVTIAVFAANSGTLRVRQSNPSAPMSIKLRNRTTNAITDLGSHTNGYKDIEVPLGGPYYVEIGGSLGVTNTDNAIEFGFNSTITSIVSIDNAQYKLKTYPRVNSQVLTSVPNSLPLSVNDLSLAFSACSSFNGAIGVWDTSNVVNMSSMFQNCGSFNQDISGWDVSSVTNMGYMFKDSAGFNQPLA